MILNENIQNDQEYDSNSPLLLNGNRENGENHE